MESFADFLSMGGYAPFVWSSYAVVGAALVGLLVWSLWDLRAREAELERVEDQAPSRRGR